MIFLILAAAAVGALAFFRAKAKLKGKLTPRNISKVVSQLLLVLGAVVGLTFTLSILSGDAKGQVNLLWLLLLFAVLPFGIFVVSMAITLIDLFRPVARGSWLKPLLELGKRLKDVQKTKLSKPEKRRWFAYHAQVYSIGCWIAYLVMMLTKDVVIVWQSKWLDKEHVLYILQTIAWPWSPCFPHLLPTGEVMSRTPATELFWTHYVFTALFFYGILPRILFLYLANIRLWLAMGAKTQHPIAPLAWPWLAGMGILMLIQVFIFTLWG